MGMWFQKLSVDYIIAALKIMQIWTQLLRFYIFNFLFLWKLTVLGGRNPLKRGVLAAEEEAEGGEL